MRGGTRSLRNGTFGIYLRITAKRHAPVVTLTPTMTTGSFNADISAGCVAGIGRSATVNPDPPADGTTLDQKMVGADGKEMSMHVTLTYDGKDRPITGSPDADSGTGKAIDAHTTDFTLKKGGKVVGTVHRVVSADGKTLTVNNKGTHADGKTYEDTLVFDKQ